MGPLNTLTSLFKGPPTASEIAALIKAAGSQKTAKQAGRDLPAMFVRAMGNSQLQQEILSALTPLAWTDSRAALDALKRIAPAYGASRRSDIIVSDSFVKFSVPDEKMSQRNIWFIKGKGANELTILAEPNKGRIPRGDSVRAIKNSLPATTGQEVEKISQELAPIFAGRANSKRVNQIATRIGHMLQGRVFMP